MSIFPENTFTSIWETKCIICDIVCQYVYLNIVVVTNYSDLYIQFDETPVKYENITVYFNFNSFSIWLFCHISDSYSHVTFITLCFGCNFKQSLKIIENVTICFLHSSQSGDIWKLDQHSGNDVLWISLGGELSIYIFVSLSVWTEYRQFFCSVPTVLINPEMITYWILLQPCILLVEKDSDTVNSRMLGSVPVAVE